MEIEAFFDSVESSNRLEGIIVPRERIEEICIGTYDVEDQHYINFDFFILMTYTPIQSKLPYLQVPENRLNLAFDWYSRQKDHPLNFPCYAYWIQQCENDGSDY